jgi:diguanylate cyclase (GGDEF)-like protein
MEVYHASHDWLVVVRGGIEAIACLVLSLAVVRLVGKRRDLSFGVATWGLLSALGIGAVTHVLLMLGGLWFPELSRAAPWFQLTGALVWAALGLGLLRLLPFFRRIPSRASLHDMRQAYATRVQYLVERAARDPLTGAYNRGKMMSLLEQEIKAPSKSRTLSALMIDIDDFKLVNDTYGHLIGDEVLKAVVKAINGAVRGQDLVARFGGEEFVVLLPQTNADDAMRVAMRVVRHVAAVTLRQPSSKVSVTCSIGVGEFVSGETAEDFLARVDRGLYASKSNGKNCATFEESVWPEAPSESGHFAVSEVAHLSKNKR